MRGVLRVATLAGCVVAGVLAAGPAGAAQETIWAECTSGGVSSVCTSAWYTSPVTVYWDASSQANALQGCQLKLTQTYSTDTATRLSCTATWADGTSSFDVPLRIELSTPTATAVPSRPPDANGWYNHPVTVAFTGNAFSGIAACTPAQTYGGPDTAGAALAGTCTDNAGKSAAASVTIPYDAAPPTLGVTAQAGDGSVVLSWQAGSGPAPLSSVQVVRAPGIGAAATVVSQGPAGILRDTRVHNHVHYTYTVIATDQAGNTTTRTLSAVPGPRLLTPITGARLRGAPMLTWTAVPRATYYNVQLYRGHTKILSTWPRRAGLQLHRTWRYGGRRRRLTPGHYRWYVWPGFGPQAAARYGRAVGAGTFVIR